MDSDRFDSIIKVLATGITRRGVGMGLAALSGLELARIDSEAKRKKKKKKKPPCKGLVGSCSSPSQCCAGLACEDVPGNCPESGTYCCAKPQGTCGDPCDCCGFLNCGADFKCCVEADDTCAVSEDCCGYGLQRPTQVRRVIAASA